MIQQTSSSSAARALSSAPLASSQSAPASAPRAFDDIIARYWQDDERSNAINFLQTLSPEELRVVSAEHRFAAPTPCLDGLSNEGANNLLRRHGQTIDENGDGLDTIGEANIWRFPNSATPPEVAAAWEEATDGMDEGDKMLLAGSLFLPLPNIREDPLTGHATVIHPGEPGYRSPYADPDYSYSGAVARKLEALDDPSRSTNAPEFYRLAKPFYGQLLDALGRHRAS